MTGIDLGWWFEMGIVCLESDERPGAAWEFRVLSSWVQRLRGLLGTREGASPVMLLRCRSIHTYGMRYPIDVAFVGGSGKVLRVVRGMAPAACASCPKAECVLERPAQEDLWVEEGEHLRAASLDIKLATGQA